jgi:cyclic-di-AMP phosphodiesterase PgpH
MKKILGFIRDRHDIIYKIILFSVTVLLIVTVFPEEGKFRYDYTLGKPWLHKDLFASFDFAIQKSDDEVRQEQALIKENMTAYYRLDTAVRNRQLEKFDIQFPLFWESRMQSADQPSPGLSQQNTYRVGRNILQHLFDAGIVEITEETESAQASDYITVISGNIAEDRQLRNLYTVPRAFSYVSEELEKHRNISNDLLHSMFDSLVVHNIYLDRAFTRKILDEQLQNISFTRGKIQQGGRIISRGELVDNEKFRVLESYKAEFIARVGGSYNFFLITAGRILLVSLALLIIFFFILLFRKDIFADNLKIIFLLLITLLMVFMASLPLNFEFIQIYMLPFGILPIVVRAFYDTRLALFTHLVTMLIIGFIAPNPYEFIFIQLLAGIFAVFSIANLSKRSQIFLTAFVIFVSYSLTYVGFAVITEGNVQGINPLFFGYFGISSMLTLFSYPLIYLFEKTFGFISDVTLIELSDTNSPLLRELATKTPGTFQHSLQVANLAEEATYEIGGDALLVRAGALYHDIGKMDMPRYFIENQSSGINPHDEISFEESAGIIISHVIRGIEKAKKHNIPEKIIDFIRTHHGDSMVQYFYRSYLQHFPDKLVDEKKFRYPGPRPFSKETAVLMMADSVEAASRSLKSYDSISIDILVENIINAQIADNQFVNADITFKDIGVIKKILKKKLATIYHVRIEYPK